MGEKNQKLTGRRGGRCERDGTMYVYVYVLFSTASGVKVERGAHDDSGVFFLFSFLFFSPFLYVFLLQKNKK